MGQAKFYEGYESHVARTEASDKISDRRNDVSATIALWQIAYSLAAIADVLEVEGTQGGDEQ